MGGGRIEVAPVLADIGRVNMLFALEAEPPGPGWRALGAPGAGSGPGSGPEAVAVEVAAEVERVRGRLAGFAGVPPEAVEWRVGASLFQQGLATRLLSPVLAAALCHGAALEAGAFHRDPGATGPVVLRTSQRWADPIAREPAAVADHIAATVLAGPLEAVADALGGAARGASARGASARGAGRRVAAGLLRGNTASALAGAARSLGLARPGVRARAEEVVRLLTSAPPLAGTGSHTGRGADGAAVFRRTTCCLYYRVPGSGYCGDCALTGPGKTR